MRERAQRAEAWKRLAKRLRARLLNATDAVAALARVLDKAEARIVELESEALALRERIRSLEKAEAAHGE